MNNDRFSGFQEVWEKARKGTLSYKVEQLGKAWDNLIEVTFETIGDNLGWVIKRLRRRIQWLIK